MKRVLVIGGGYAGVLMALRLSRKARPGELEIELVAAADHFVERIRLHQVAAGQELPLIPFGELLAGSGIKLVQGWVTRIKEVICWGTTLLMQEDLDFAPIRYWE